METRTYRFQDENLRSKLSREGKEIVCPECKSEIFHELLVHAQKDSNPYEEPEAYSVTASKEITYCTKCNWIMPYGLEELLVKHPRKSIQRRG